MRATDRKRTQTATINMIFEIGRPRSTPRYNITIEPVQFGGPIYTTVNITDSSAPGARGSRTRPPKIARACSTTYCAQHRYYGPRRRQKFPSFVATHSILGGPPFLHI